MEESNVEFREWLELLDECKYAQLKEEINEENAANLAEFFEEVPEEKRLLVFRLFIILLTLFLLVC